MSEVHDIDAVGRLSDIDACYTVFEGSSEEDVAHAKVFWSSLCLQPPIESSLVSVDITQRLKVSKDPQRRICDNVCKQPPWSRNDELLQKAYQLQMQDEKQRYLEMAKKRDKIMALLKKQREDRIKKWYPARTSQVNLSRPRGLLASLPRFWIKT
ncbi:cilia- and flagella-associated protein HOATZ isoform X2 [Tachysurus vachellii]|uniref:cilia- and flagella-associated protein HOATZ isoform X2 n=1 Tax=Tachysurus vachellii TaxID=175792 RepID=UPI00296B4ABD|nr:cilia- and flagella-associated protein HOATZ isoform X2 [Tachysurus vachellii]